MRSDLESNRSRDLNIISGNFGTRRIRAQGNINLNELLPNTVIDPNGADRIVTLCKPAEGVFCLLTNNGSANALTIRSQAGATIDTLQPGDGQFFYSDGLLWYATGLTASDWHVFGPAGPPHSSGLVPDPGPVAGLQRVLYDDGTWKTVSVGGPTDAYKQISDGTNTTVAQGLSQLRLRSSDGSLAIVVTENDPTFGDVANLIANAANINHNTLFNYVADQHVPHSSVSVLAGSGLTGGGTIAATRTLALDLAGLATLAPVLTDTAPFFSTSAGGPRKYTFAVLNGILDHNSLLNYSSDRHIAHSAVTITAGNGLSGGGDITAPRTISLDINGLAVDVPAVGDFIPFYDISQGDLNKASFATLNGILDHNALLNYVPNQHIDHTLVSIATAAGTSGLTGGGTIAATRNLTVDINGLTVDATPDLAADYMMTFDASAAGLKKVLLTTVGGAASNSVRYDIAQSLTAPQQQQARQNIYAAPFDALAYNGMQINGAMDVSQELGTTGISGRSGYVIDGWQLYYAGTMVMPAAQAVGTPLFPGLPSCIYSTVTTAQAALGAGDNATFFHSIEGWRIGRLNWGTVNAQPLTIGFWTMHHRTGLYSGSVRNKASNRSYAFTYTQVGVDVPQYNVVTIPGDTAGTWANDNTIGLQITFAMACGTTYTAPAANTWYGGLYVAAPGQVNAVGATTDVFRITGVIVLPGIEAPAAARSAFIMRPFPQELVTCQRYYLKYASLFLATSYGVASQPSYFTYLYGSPMRSSPTITLPNQSPTNIGTITATASFLTNIVLQGTVVANGAANTWTDLICDARL